MICETHTAEARQVISHHLRAQEHIGFDYFLEQHK
jgi:hypothetical protein